MNWHKKLIKFAGAKDKINKLGIANPALKLFIYKYEKQVDWNKVKTKEDLENIISTEFLPSLQSKIDPSSKNNNYMKDIDLEKEFAQDPNNPEIQVARRIYQADPQGAKDKILKVINDDKKRSFSEWWNYLTQENDVYKENPAFAYSVLKPIIDSSPETKKGAAPPINAEILGLVWDELATQGSTQMNILKRYSKIASEVDKQSVEKIGTKEGGEWIRIPSESSDSKNFRSNVDKLKRFSMGTGWCTAYGNAEPYLSQGDFWLYLMDGKATVAIRLIGNRVKEIRGHHNKDENLTPYWEPVVNFLSQSGLDYKECDQYKTLEKTMLMNADIEAGDTEKINYIIDLIKNDPTQYRSISEKNRANFPEFMTAAAEGYSVKINDKLLEIEVIGLRPEEYLRKFDLFQDYYKAIPEEVKNVLGDIKPRILQAHKSAFYHNPILFPEFSSDIQKVFSQEEQIAAWHNYIGQDPYHYNDKRIPSDIKQNFPLNNLKAEWAELLQRNPEHIDYMSPQVLQLFDAGEVEKYVLADFAKFPVSQVRGKYDKLQRVEKFVASGLITRKQIVDAFKSALRTNPGWMDYVPPQYKDEVLGGQNISQVEYLLEEKKNHVMRDPGYWKSLTPDLQEALLQNYGDEIGQAFARNKDRYPGMLHQFWVSVPDNVRPYLPADLIDATAQYYANILNRQPSNIDALMDKVPIDIQPYVLMKLSYNWYRKRISA